MYFDGRLWALAKGVRGRVAVGVLVGILAAGVGVARLGLLGWLLALVLQGAPLDALIEPTILVAAVMVARGGLEYLRAMLAHHTAALVQVSLRRKIYDQVVALGPAHFGRERTGDVVLSMVEGVEQLETYFGQYLPQLFVAALTPILIFSFLAWLDLPIATTLLVAALITLIAPAAWHRMDSRNSIARQRAYGAFGAEFLDSLQGLVTLKAFGQSGARAQLLAKKARDLFQTTMWVLGTNTLARGITDTGIAIGATVALGWGAFRVVEGAMPLSTLLIVLMLGVEVFRPLRELRSLLHQGMVGLSAAQGIFEILGAKPVITDAAVARTETLQPSVAFDDVVFGYPGGRRQALRGFSFTVRAGERLGIVGGSGAGKSTISKLLLRLYDPQGGAIRVGGKDLREISLRDLRGLIAVVSQDSYLFHGTIEDNLRMGRPDATQAQLEDAARSANAHEFIARLPQGYQTVVGERGVRLSGGQRQRIAIARALLRDAPILVLDEALSSVDAENEQVIQEALDRLMVGRTTLVFAHRLSSIIGSDRILVVEHGRVAETGSHAELMRAGGLYQRLMSAQAQDKAPELILEDLPAVAAPEARETVEAAAPTEGVIRADGLNWFGLLGVLMKLVGPWWPRLVATFGFGVLRVAAFIGVGVLSAFVVRAVRSGDPFTDILIGLAVVAPLAGILHWMESWIAHDMAYRLLAEMRIDIFRKLDALAPAYMTRRRTGDLLGVATHDVEMIEYFFAHTIAPAFVAIVVPATVLIVLATFGWPIALALAPFLLYAGLSPVFLRRRIDALGSRAREGLGELNAFAVDSVQGLSDIVAFQDEGRRGASFVERAKDYVAIRLRFFRDLTFQTAAQEVVTGLGGLAVVLSGAWLVATGSVDAGILPLLTILAMASFLPVSEIAQVGRQLADTLGSTRRVFAVHSEKPAVVDGPGAARAEADVPALEMDAVQFLYPGRSRRALSNVSFAVPRGASVALVGPSGAGKSTVAALFLRFWDPGSGSVRMDGADLKSFKLDDLRKRIALVAQDTYLFNDTLRHNIMIARPDASEAELREAVRQAALQDFVEGLPEGLDTHVGERGAQLSGGQRQRVAIARAFLKQAPILILDEATSHLDALSEAAVLEALDRLMQGRTTVVIAHRLSTVRKANRIVVLQDGALVETGTHAELLGRGGLYARLVQRQLAGAAAE